jgi:hypothetical protein
MLLAFPYSRIFGELYFVRAEEQGARNWGKRRAGFAWLFFFSTSIRIEANLHHFAQGPEPGR